jgi:AraC-like DNA-binding protein
MAIGDGRLRRVSGAITWIKEHFAEPLRIEDLAKRVHMSPSALHSHFKAVAAMSPIQYQKRLRLLEARRLLLSGAASAEAIPTTGYASASQFSRENLVLRSSYPPRREPCVRPCPVEVRPRILERLQLLATCRLATEQEGFRARREAPRPPVARATAVSSVSIPGRERSLPDAIGS